MDRLKCIRTFIQISRCASLAAAAEQLGISRSLAGEHLRQLEEHLGVRLVTRTSRQMALTRMGEEYLAQSLTILKTVAEADARITQLQMDPEGPVKVMASMAFATYRLGPIIIDFTRRNPAISINLQIVDRSFYIEEFIDGSYDLGISTHSVKDTELISTKLTDVTWAPCATPAYLASHPKVRNPDDLASQTCLIHQRHAPDGVWEFLGGEPQTAAVRVNGCFSTNSALVLRDAALSDLGIAMLPTYLVSADIEQGRLVRVLPEWKCRQKPAYLIYPQMKHLPRRTRVFIDYLREAFRQQSA
jgi:DNA-binding transcriptional LysR family regulator